MALDFPASSASPFIAPNGVIYTWNAAGYWEAKADPNDFDASYLKLDATNGPVTGDLTFEGQTIHEAKIVSTIGGADSFKVTSNSSISPYVSISRNGGGTSTERLFSIGNTSNPVDGSSPSASGDGVFNVSADGSVYALLSGTFGALNVDNDVCLKALTNAASLATDANGKIVVGTGSGGGGAGGNYVTVDTTQDVTGQKDFTKASVSRPSDFWTSTPSFFIGEIGSIATSGSHQVHLTAGGYRSDANSWVSTAPGGAIGAAQVLVSPTGYVGINAETSKATGSGTGVGEIAKFAPDKATFKTQVQAASLYIPTANTGSIKINRSAVGQYGGITWSEVGDERFLLYNGNTEDAPLTLQARKNGGNIKTCFAADNATGVVDFPAGLTGTLTGNASSATNCSRSVTGSNGLSGGGALTSNQVISGVNATTSAKGVVQLNDATNSTSTTTAATANAAKKAYDRAAAYAPSKTGSGASGTWGISISGSSGSTTNATNCSRSVTGSNGLTGGGALNKNQVISGVNATTSAKGVVQLSSATNSTSSTVAATAGAVKSAYDRVASYAPSKTGSGASGKWGIDISGTAGFATNSFNTQVLTFNGASDWRSITVAGTGSSSHPTSGSQVKMTVQSDNNKQLRTSGNGDIVIPGTINTNFTLASRTITTDGSNNAMNLKSSNGKFNFQTSNGTTGYTINAANGNAGFVTPENAALAINYDEEGEYIGPVTSPVAEALTAIKTAAQDATLDLSGLKIAIASALASFGTDPEPPTSTGGKRTTRKKE